jgi:Carboxypeptidase regulatory-like domain
MLAHAILRFCLVAGAVLDTGAGHINVSGRVVDPGGTPVSQYPVVLRNKATNASLYAVTDAQGSYYFANLVAGPYVLGSVKQPGTQLEVSLGDSVGSMILAPLIIKADAAPASLQLGADVQETGKKFRNGQKQYDFSFWLTGPQVVLRSISRVEYHLVYKPNSLKIPGDASDARRAFSGGYTGWGCYENVSASILYKDGRSETKRFDMCESLGWN